jgi:LacI family transcriptional regulator
MQKGECQSLLPQILGAFAILYFAILIEACLDAVVSPNNHSSPGLASIAKELGLSISTVSRALRNTGGIHSETRSLVLRTAASQGYDSARRRATGPHSPRPRNIMVLVQCNSPLTDLSYRTGMNRASVALNFAMLSHYVSGEECATLLDPRYQPTALKGGLVDALVLVHRWPQDVAAELAQKWPSVSIMHHYPDAPLDYIGIDDRNGMLSLVRHLSATGRNRIGFFGLCREMSWACSRFAAYVEALVSTGLPYDGRNVVEINLVNAMSPTNFPVDGWWEQVRTATRANRVDAWICSSAATSHTLCRVFLDQHFRMPEDIAVAGYHRGVSAPADLPSITSTVVADEELGAAAVHRILHRLEYPEESHRSILVPVKFVQGATTAAIPSTPENAASIVIR